MHFKFYDILDKYEHTNLNACRILAATKRHANDLQLASGKRHVEQQQL